MWRSILTALFMALCLSLSPGLFAQSSVTRQGGESEADKPTKPVEVRIPGAPITGGQDGDVTPGDADGDGEQDDDDDDLDNADGPTFFGEPVFGNFIFCLDRSGSMLEADNGSGPITDWNGNTISTPNRLIIVKTEAINVIIKLKKENEFAIVSFGGGDGQPEWKWYTKRVPATDTNKAKAIQEIQSMVAAGWTPAYTALQKSCKLYGTDIANLFVVTDGSPNKDSGAPGGEGSPDKILANFPGWYAGMKAEGCRLVCIHIGNDDGAATFMNNLANQNGGDYLHK